MLIKKNSDQIKELIKLYTSGNLTKAENEAKILIQKYPESFILFNILGVILNSQKKFEQAIINFNEALKINPNFAQAENNLGVTYQKLNNLDEAVLHFSKAIDLNHNFAEAQNNLGIVLKKKNKLNEAVDHFKKALKIKTDYEEAKESLGSVYLQMGNYIEGLEMISQGTGFIRFTKNSEIEIINTLNNAKN